MSATATTQPIDAAACWGSCCVIDPDEGLQGQVKVPWFRFILGLFVAGQTMLLGIAINLTPPESETTNPRERDLRR